jgi:hypothetical protein
MRKRPKKGIPAIFLKVARLSPNPPHRKTHASRYHPIDYILWGIKMKKIAVVFFNIACLISCVVGIGHFFAPYIFKWYSYIPDAPIEIYQSINYVNFCFSFLLAGLSFILIIVQKQLFAGLKEVKLFYMFFVLVWFSRVIIQVIWPWPSSVQVWLMIGFSIEFVFTLVPIIFLFGYTAKRGV